MGKPQDEAPAVRVRTDIGSEKDIYVSVSEDTCFAKFAYEHLPENEELRDYITAVCDAVAIGLRRLNGIVEDEGV